MYIDIGTTYRSKEKTLTKVMKKQYEKLVIFY